MRRQAAEEETRRSSWDGGSTLRICLRRFLFRYNEAIRSADMEITAENKIWKVWRVFFLFTLVNEKN